MKPTYEYELVILGGGPCGMTAGIYAARANLSTIVLETNITGGLVNSTYTVENFPSYPSIHGMELMQKMRDHLDSLNVPVEEACEVEMLELSGNPKIVETYDAIYKAKAVILATGRKPIPLDVPTECEQAHFCAICDGAPYVGKHVLVVGGGNSAFDESLYMLKIGVERITLIEVMDRYFAAKTTQDELFGNAGVTGHTCTKVKDVVVKDGVLKAALLENVQDGKTIELPCDGIFVFLGQKPNNELFKDVVELNPQGYIKADPRDMSTNVPGVFGAGDINDKAYRQISTAVADGTIAALAAERYIRTLK